MKAYTESFASHPIDREELEKNNESKANSPIDLLDIEGFEKTITSLQLEGPHNEADIKILTTEKYAEFITAIHSVNEADIVLLFSKITEPDSVSILDDGNPKNSEEAEDENSKTSIFTKFVKDTEEGTLPPEVFIKLLKRYKETLESYNDILQEFAPAFKDSIVRGFLLKIDPLLEDKKDEHELKDILERVTLRIKDPLSNSVSVGTHVAGNLTIELSLTHLLQAISTGGESTREFLNLIAHESLHAISTGTVLKQTRTYSYGEDVGSIEMPRVVAQWSGVSAATTGETRLRWLNEALTETLSTTIANIEPTSYHDEIQLFRLLMSKGVNQINQSIFVNAYFEDKGYASDSDDDTVIKYKHWKHLRNCIRDAYPHDPQFLVKLDNFIQRNSVGEAIKLMENWDPSSPAPL